MCPFSRQGLVRAKDQDVQRTVSVEVPRSRTTRQKPADLDMLVLTDEEVRLPAAYQLAEPCRRIAPVHGEAIQNHAIDQPTAGPIESKMPCK